MYHKIAGVEVITIYTKDGCSFCQTAKELMKTKGVSYDEVVVGNDSNGDIKREEFMRLFPEVKTLPYLMTDGRKIGGYAELIDHLNPKLEN